MRHWIAIAALAGLAACATTQKEPPPKPFVGTSWLLLLDLPSPGEPPKFRFGDGRMEGFAGCNRVNARYVQDSIGSRFIAIGRIETGRRACDRSAQDAENHTLQILQTVSSYTITADIMVMSGSGGTLRFRAVPEEKKP